MYYYLTKLCGYDVLNMEEILSNHKMFSNYDVYCVMQWQCLNVKFDNVSLNHLLIWIPSKMVDGVINIKFDWFRIFTTF